MASLRNSQVTGKTRLSSFGLIAILAILTFAIPAIQALTSKFGAPLPYRGPLSGSLIILCVWLWYRQTKAFPFFPASPSWKVFCYVGSIVVFGLLIINIRNEPVSKITGQARLPSEVIDVIILLVIAEELVFRGMMWSIFERLSRSGRRSVVALVGTSVLFGVEHLGYWAQSSWPLPPDAIVHALSMVAAGGFFGAFRLTSRSVAVPMVVHMLANGVILLTQ
jgi:membrane protease YdiL (CAAX protease family)